MGKPKTREYIHLQLPVGTLNLLNQLNYDTRVSRTEIIVRLLEQARKQGVLEDWIKTGGPVPSRPTETQEARPEHR